MSKPIVLITVPGTAAITDEKMHQIAEQFRKWEDYRVMTVVEDPCAPVRDRIRVQLMNTGFWDKLFDYLNQRRQRLHDMETDSLRNKIHELTEKCERIARERDEFKRIMDNQVVMRGKAPDVYDALADQYRRSTRIENPTMEILENYGVALRVNLKIYEVTSIDVKTGSTGGDSNLISFTTKNRTR